MLYSFLHEDHWPATENYKCKNMYNLTTHIIIFHHIDGRYICEWLYNHRKNCDGNVFLLQYNFDLSFVLRQWVKFGKQFHDETYLSYWTNNEIAQ